MRRCSLVDDELAACEHLATAARRACSASSWRGLRVDVAERQTLADESKNAERRELSGDARIIALMPTRTSRIASPWAVSALIQNFDRLSPPPSPEAQRFGHLEGT
jgi:hypothetical protein